MSDKIVLRKIQENRVNYIKNNKALILSILAISLPAIAEMALNTLVGIADTLMISRIIGKEALAAAGYANQVVFTTIFIFSSFNIGATAIIARCYGEKDYDRLKDAAGQNLLLNVSIGLLVTILSLLLSRRLMGIFEMTPEVTGMGVSYLNIVSCSQIFMFISFAASASLRGVQDTRTPMIITGMVNILNIIGNYVLMTGFWFFPNLGLEGAAISTTCSRLIGAAAFILVLLRNKGHLRLELHRLRISSEVLKPLWKLSSVAGIEQFLMQISFFVMSIIISLLNTDSEAAFRVMLTIEQVSFMPAIGISIAASTLVGKALGEQDRHKARLTGYISAGFGILWGIFMGSIFIFYPSIIVQAFTDDAGVIKNVLSAMPYAGLDQPLLAFIIILSGALRGAGDTRSVMSISIGRLWLVFVPLTYVFVVYLHMGIKSVYIAEIFSLLLFDTIIYLRFRSGKWMDIKL